MRINIKIKGMTPLLMHRFTDEAALAATSGQSTALRSKNRSPKEQAESYLHKDESGKIIIPQPMIFGSLINAGTFFKNGKSKITTQRTSLIPALVDINDLYFPLKYNEDWTVDTRPVRNPSTGGRFLCHRPCFNDWGIKFEAEIDETGMSERLFRDIVDTAGKRIGIGAFRPACKGPFGKFEVVEWQTEV